MPLKSERPELAPKNRQAVNPSSMLAAVHQHGVILPSFDHSISDLLLQRFRYVASP